MTETSEMNIDRLNSRHTADPDIQGPFWDYVDGKISLEELRKS